MKSPKDMKIIQIELTNACGNRCANCTRFCGHQTKPFFMDFNTFKKAVDSMAGFSGIVGLMGGEPTLHPDFEKFVRYFKEHFGPDNHSKEIFKGPDSGFIDYICKHKFNIKENNKRGLWSSMGPKYYKYFELIQDTFGYQALNDHSSSSMHESLMVTRKELKIPDNEWYTLRDRCWIQSIWSASITPKGAFFCEVAAALDMLFDGPGGWPIEPGWWKRRPSEFGDQLRWCELCSAPLAMPKRDANKEIDDASPVWCAMLEKIQSPKYLQGKVNLFDVKSYNPKDYSIINESLPYLQDQSKRLENGNGGLEPQNLSIWLDIRNSDPKNILDLVKHNLTYTKIDGVLISHDGQSNELKALKIPLISLPQTDQNLTITQAASITGARDFVLVLKDYYLRGDPREIIRHFVYNPGNYYYHVASGTVDCTLFNLRASSLIGDPEFDQLQNAYPIIKHVCLKTIPDQTVAIYQVCHKPSTWISNDVFHPIHVGKAISNENFGIQGDDTGNNISEKNETHAELTALFWIWKNNTTQTYLGLCHYRRIFIFNPQIAAKVKRDRRIVPNLTNGLMKENGWMPSQILEFVSGADIFITRPWNNPRDNTQGNHYKIMHGEDSYARLHDGILTHAPEYYPYLIQFFSNKDLITGHMFVMRREILDTYCSWLFPLLERIYQTVDYHRNDKYNIREPAFAAERLFHIYIQKLRIDHPELIIKELPWIIIQDTTPKIRSLPALIKEKPVIPIVTTFDNNSAPIFSVFLESLISSSSSDYFYDLIILSDAISGENIRILTSQISSHINFSIRFFEMSSMLNIENQKFDLQFTKSTFYRLSLSTILPEYFKVLYIDPDTVVLDDPVKIFNENISEKYAASIRCLNAMEARLSGIRLGKPYNNVTIQKYFESEVGLFPEKLDDYFNAGVIVFNLENMRKDGVENIFLNLNYLKKYYFNDQDILNKVFLGKVALLHQRWNVIPLCRSRPLAPLPYAYEKEYLEGIANPAIIHYAAPYNKPWLNETVPFGEIFWMFARKSPYYEKILKQYLESSKIPKNKVNLFLQQISIKQNIRMCMRQDIKTNLSSLWHFIHHIRNKFKT